MSASTVAIFLTAMQTNYPKEISGLPCRLAPHTQDPRGRLRLRRPDGLQQPSSQGALLVGHVVHGRQSQEILIDVVAHRAHVLERAGDVDALDVLRVHPENLLDGRVPGSPVRMLEQLGEGRHGLVEQLMNPSVDVLEQLVLELGKEFLKLLGADLRAHRSEERRVGKECRSRWSPYH